MNPNTGELYSSPMAAKLAGVENPVLLVGGKNEVERISKAVKHMKAAEDKKARRKRAQKSKRHNREK